MNKFSQSTIDQINNIRQKYAGKTIGFTCSAFDLFHCGHILMLKDAKKQCDVLVVGLHSDPNINRKSKNVPIQELEERYIQVEGCKYVSEIIFYDTEDDLLNILRLLKPDVRILGTDWKNKLFTGCHLPINIHWHSRDHEWSTTYLRERVYIREKATKNMS